MTAKIEKFPGVYLKESDFQDGKILFTEWNPNAQYAWDAGVAIGRYLRELKEAFPAESAGIDDLFLAVARVASDTVRYGEDRTSGSRPSSMEMMERYPDMAQAFSLDWRTFMAMYVGDARLQAVVSTLWGYFGLPPSQVSAGLFALALGGDLAHFERDETA